MRRKIIGRPHMQKYFMVQRYSLVQKLSTESAKVICKFDRRRTAHGRSQKSY